MIIIHTRCDDKTVVKCSENLKLSNPSMIQCHHIDNNHVLIENSDIVNGNVSSVIVKKIHELGGIKIELHVRNNITKESRWIEQRFNETRKQAIDRSMNELI